MEDYSCKPPVRRMVDGNLKLKLCSQAMGVRGGPYFFFGDFIYCYHYQALVMMMKPVENNVIIYYWHKLCFIPTSFLRETCYCYSPSAGVWPRQRMVRTFLRNDGMGCSVHFHAISGATAGVGTPYTWRIRRNSSHLLTFSTMRIYQIAF